MFPSDAPIGSEPLSAFFESKYYGLLYEQVDLSAEGTSVAIAPRVLTDNASMNDSAVAVAVTVLIEGIKMSSTLATGQKLYPVLSEEVKFNDALVRAAQASLTEGVVLSDSVAVVATLVAQILESITANDTARPGLSYTISDIVQMSDSLKRVVAETIGEGVTFSGVLTLAAATALSDVVNHSETLASVRRGLELLQEGVGFTDAATPAASMYAMLTEGVLFGGQFDLNGVTYDAFVTNTHTLAPATYTNFNFNSFAEPNLAATETAIYQLTGDDDAGTNIAAHITTGLSDYGSAKNKAYPDVWLGGTFDGKMVLKVVTSQNGVATEDWYEVTPDLAAPDSRRFKPGRGLKSRYWKWRLENRSGADFDLDTMELRPVLLGRTH